MNLVCLCRNVLRQLVVLPPVPFSGASELLVVVLLLVFVVVELLAPLEGFVLVDVPLLVELVVFPLVDVLVDPVELDVPLVELVVVLLEGLVRLAVDRPLVLGRLPRQLLPPNLDTTIRRFLRCYCL